jgi:uncharacterized protein YecE (DUF72 family)
MVGGGTAWTNPRFHGQHYGGSYSPTALAAHARRIRHWRRQGHDVYVYLNNDLGGHAPRNASELRRLLLGLGCRASYSRVGRRRRRDGVG